MTDLETLLDQNTAPTVRRSLSARILAAAETAGAANDMGSRRPWWSLGGIAAMAIIATIFFVQPRFLPITGSDEQAADWEQIADGSGFTELYEWVEGDGEGS